MGDDAEQAIWEEFSSIILDHLFPQELREVNVEEFENLKQLRMTVKKY